MIDNINTHSQSHFTCKKCGNIQNKSDDLNRCQQCGWILQEFLIETANTFTNQKIDGEIYDIDEYKDKSVKAEENIQDMIRDLKLNSDYPEYLDRIGATPLRIIKFAYKGMFLDNGTNIKHYSAAALYIALRFHKAPFLLMDFSDKLAVNLFKLAKCYRKLAKFLNVTLKLNEKLPAIDPSLYIPRFCQEINFGEKMNDVKATAIKLLKRMKLDWMAHGRRPSSLCGVAILIAGRMHGFKLTPNDMSNTVLVCEETLKKRLQEFTETEVASLTVEKFDQIDVEKMGIQRDPPAFINNQRKQEKQMQKMLEHQQQLQIKEKDVTETQQSQNNIPTYDEKRIAQEEFAKKQKKLQDLEESKNYNQETQQMHKQYSKEDILSEQKDFNQVLHDFNSEINHMKKQKDFKDEELHNLQQVTKEANEETQVQQNGKYLQNEDNEEDYKRELNDKSLNENQLTLHKQQLLLNEKQSQQQEKNKQNYDLALNNTQLKDINRLDILQDKGELNEEESLSNLSDEDRYVVPEDEIDGKRMLWLQINNEWLQEQKQKQPKIMDAKNKTKKKTRRNDQLLNEDDPVVALIGSKTKKIKNNLSKEALTQLLKKRVGEVKKISFPSVFENAEKQNEEISIEYGAKPLFGISTHDNQNSEKYDDVKKYRNKQFNQSNINGYRFGKPDDEFDYDDDGEDLDALD